MVVLDIEKMAGSAVEVSHDNFEDMLTKMKFDVQNIVQILIQIEQDVHKSRLITAMFNTTSIQHSHYLSNNLLKVQQDLCKETHTTTRMAFELQTAQEKIELYRMQADDHKCKTLEQEKKIEDLRIRLIESEKNLRTNRVDLKEERRKRFVLDEDNKKLKAEISARTPGDTALMVQNTQLLKKVEELEIYNVKTDKVKMNLIREVEDIKEKHERLVDESMQGICILSAQHAMEKKGLEKEIKSLKNSFEEMKKARNYFEIANSDLEKDYQKIDADFKEYKSSIKDRVVARKQLWVFFEEWKILYAKSADVVDLAARTTVSMAINNCYANNILGLSFDPFFNYDDLLYANVLPVLLSLRQFFLNTTHYHVYNMVQGMGIFVTPEVVWDVVYTFYDEEFEVQWIGIDGQADRLLCASDVLFICRKASLLSSDEANYNDPLKSGRVMRKLARVLYKKMHIN